jgi:hypothetical protein
MARRYKMKRQRVTRLLAAALLVATFGISACGSGSNTEPLHATAAPVPKLQARNYSTGGSCPQFSAPGIDLSAVNAAFLHTILADQKSYLPFARRAYALNPRAPEGGYSVWIKWPLVSASNRVVSALMRVEHYSPGGTGFDAQGWLWTTAEVPSGRVVHLRELFAEPKVGLRWLAGHVNSRLVRTNACVRAELRHSGAPRQLLDINQYKAFALTPRGLAIAFRSGAAAAPCGMVVTIVPYSELQPYLSKRGASLIAGVRAPTR